MGERLDPHRVGICRADSATYDAGNIQAAIASVLSQIGLEADPVRDERGPLASVISPGDTVLLKPNMVRQCHKRNGDWEYVITHGEIVRAVAFLAAQALQKRGRLVIADGPHDDSDFPATAAAMRLADIQREVSQRLGIEVEVMDLREGGQDRRPADAAFFRGDPAGCVDFDLADRSEFSGYQSCNLLYGQNEDVAMTRSAHAEGRHLYRLARTPIDSDVFINLPKMKTHRKSGVSLSLKNMVGIHGDRNYLPHYTVGPPSRGGDQSPGDVPPYPRRLLRRAHRLVSSASRPVIGQGNWYGNDTAWRMVLDLNKILLYGRPDGSFAPTPWKRCLTIVDGIIGGEGDGPMAPDPKAVGLLVAGANGLAVDTASTILMGFDPARIRMVSRAWEVADLPLADFSASQVECCSNVAEWNGSLQLLMQAPHCSFAPYVGWQGHIERPQSV